MKNAKLVMFLLSIMAAIQPAYSTCPGGCAPPPPPPPPPTPTMPNCGTIPAGLNPNTIAGVALNLLQPALSAPGATADSIESATDQLFVQVQLCNFWFSQNLTSMIEGLSSQELAELSQLYYSHGGDVQWLMDIAASRATAPALRILAATFGESAMQSAVNVYAAPATRTAYAALAENTAVPMSLQYEAKFQIDVTVTPSPQLNWSLYEIYLDYRTAGWTVTEALTATANFARTPLTTAFAVGFGAGQVILYVWPTLPSNIGEILCNYTCPGLPPVPNGTVTVEPTGVVELPKDQCLQADSCGLP